MNILRAACLLLLLSGCSSSNSSRAPEPPPTDLPPTATIRLNPAPPASSADYPLTAQDYQESVFAPRSPVYLSAADSFDPEQKPITTFWNVQDPTGQYTTIDPDPAVARVSFVPAYVGNYTINLTAVEVTGNQQLTQSMLLLPIDPAPCAKDGVSAPCSDELPVAGGSYIAGSVDDVGFPNEHPSHSATVASFVMDEYEVTVGRFRRFLADLTEIDFAEGAGAHPQIQGSGWQLAWNGQDSQGVAMSVSECGGPWTMSPGGNEARPVTCVTWYQAFAFCIWEGKRLPTEAEWEFAAVGGSEQRMYPWGSAPPSPILAVYGCSFDGRDDCSDADLPVVGSVKAGAGRFGHLDLAGSVWEWTLDSYAPYTAEPCNNCANLSAAEDDGRVFRGGNYLYDDPTQPSDLRGASRLGFDAKFPDQTRGFRCARTP